MCLQMWVALLEHAEVFRPPLCDHDVTTPVDEERRVIANASANLEHSLVRQVEAEGAEVLLATLVVLDVMPVVEIIDGRAWPGYRSRGSSCRRGG